jgi:hypothetical protein
MRVRFTLAGLLALSVVFTAGGAELPALTFVRGMLGAVKAEEVDCPASVIEAVTLRGMSVVCAHFEGSFESFRSAWDAQHVAEFGRGARESVRGEPRTGWELRGETYERIYSVRQSVIGVRFWSGNVILVYT